MEEILLIGAGGHCRSILDTMFNLNKYNIYGILDINSKVGQDINGIPIIGTDNDLKRLYNEGIRNAFITIGSIGDVSIRYSIFTKLKLIGFNLPIIIDKTAIVSQDAFIGEGSFIGKGTIINTNVNIGNMCIINTGTIIDHDCKIGNFVHIAPGSTLSGGVEIEDNVHIGTNSTIIQYKKIGKNSLIGAGSVVVKDIAANSKGFGNPYKEIL
ncbi:MAG: acetyltransferase [Clostridiaceae bacterium]